MNELELLKKRVQSNLNSYTRAALLAECGSRVLPVYEAYWVGTYDSEIVRSVEIGWNFACNNPINKEEYQTCLQVVSDTLLFYLEEDIDVLSSSVAVIQYLLESISATDEESSIAVAKGLFSAEHVADCAEGMADDETPIPSRKEIAVLEEHKWQEKAIKLAENWAGVVDCNMFNSLNSKPPKWLIDWKTRCDL